MFCLSNPAAAVNKNIKLDKYYQATCPLYTGTWTGFITNPTNLFGNGGPWPITINLYSNGNHIVGRSSAVDYGKGGNIPSKPIWAQCQNGILSNIFWGEKGSCGRFSQQGLLVSQNVLILQFNWENAMSGTSFLSFLERKNNSYSDPVPEKKNDFILGGITSCH
jgi:hypothetical protein